MHWSANSLSTRLDDICGVLPAHVWVSEDIVSRRHMMTSDLDLCEDGQKQ